MNIKKEKYKNNKDYEFREILNYNPNWLVRWGVTIIAIIVLILIYISTYINEPEVIKSKFTVYLNRATDNKSVPGSGTDSMQYKCKMNIEITEKSKLKIGEYIDAELNLNSTLSILYIKGKVDSIKFNPDIEKYELLISISSGLLNSVKEEVTRSGNVVGTGKIIIENISLFDRIFSKYKTINKF